MALRLLLVAACLAGLAGPAAAAAPSGVTVAIASFTTRLSESGEVDCFCSLHPRMTGRVIVTPAS